MTGREDKQVVLGRITAAHGVRGWVRTDSFTDPPAALCRYAAFGRGAAEPLRIESARSQGAAVLIKFAGIEDRDAAAALAGTELAVPRSQLPPTGEGEYYWVDLLGLRVENLAGADLGRIERLLDLPGQTVMVLVGERERLVPIVRGRTVRRVDVDAGLVVVDWDSDW